jgi:hypothetical protein
LGDIQLLEFVELHYEVTNEATMATSHVRVGRVLLHRLKCHRLHQSLWLLLQLMHDLGLEGETLQVLGHHQIRLALWRVLKMYECSLLSLV